MARLLVCRAMRTCQRRWEHMQKNFEHWEAKLFSIDNSSALYQRCKF